VSGYNLDSLLPEDGFHVAKALVGSECTCVIVLEAKCRLVYSPPARTLVVLGYEDIYIGADDIPRLLEFNPIGLEGIDERLVDDMKSKKLNLDKLPLLPQGKGWLLVEFGGEDKKESDANAQKMMDALRKSSLCPSMRRYDDKNEEKRVWKIRESGLGATAFVPGKPRTWEGWEDSAVDPKNLGKYLRDFRKLLDRYHYTGDLYGHFGQACVHTRIDFDLESAAGVAKYRSFIDEAADLVIKYGGSLSGEHGDGQSRGALLPKMFGEDLIEAFREFKSIWDPDWKMNPGKVVTPYEPTENLRLGADYKPWEPKTHFKFPEDHGKFPAAVLRCVGVGECRRMEGGTMCPSYMATWEEEHSTRGRAHLLFEMFNGQEIPTSWRNEAVKDALDLCLACKGCKGDCPVNVDMATYKSEFLSHYYKGRLRPVSGYAMGFIHRWSRLASIMPRISNVMMRLAKPLIGVAPQRTMPKYARKTFRAQFQPKPLPPDIREPGLRVLLWPDTFNNYFFPETALAASDVLHRSGYEVVIPHKQVCCGRPLYDWGFLDAAKKLLLESIATLQPEIDRGTPIVGLEPSCVSVFRDELGNLFPGRQVHMMTLSEFIKQAGDAFRMPHMKRKAIVQGHCHHKAIMKFEAEEEVMRKMGLEFEHLDSGCCGMAGAFGFEKEHYDISMRVGERMLLPRVREAERDTLIIADGFSCREQIEQSTGRRALHLAEVLQMAMNEAGDPSDRDSSSRRPE
ncbi:MAG TPA: FAD-linked oxidase C-terminal domain-containing protein, partial [Thermoanaerobaculia bacterium]|nr:FAD-linked oxidase C-terminal domain-containing protein [Thermoanaerobaculia bacterium]